MLPQTAAISHDVLRERPGWVLPPSQLPIVMAIIAASVFPADSSSQQDEGEPNLFAMSIEQLLDIKIITASKMLQRVAEAPASLVVLTREEIENYGFLTVEDVLLNIPGLYGIDDYGEGGPLYGIRGFWSGVPNDNIIVLVNSVPQTKNAFSNHPMSQIPVPVGAIDRIEVVRGPMSVVYGSGAFFGAINIITDDARGGAAGNHASVGIGSSGLGRIFARTTTSGADYSLSVNASYERDGGIDQPYRDMLSDVSVLPGLGLSEQSTSGGTLESERKFVNLSGASRGLSFRLVVVESNEEVSFQLPSATDGHQAEYTDYNLSVGYSAGLTEDLTIEARAGSSRDRAWFRYKYFDDDFLGLQEVSSSAVEATVDLFYNPGPKLSLATGLQYKSILTAFNQFDLPSFSLPSLENNYIFLDEDDDIVTRGAYAQIQVTPTEAIQLVAGARLEQSPRYAIHGWEAVGTAVENRASGVFDKDEVELVPRFAAILTLSNSSFLKLLYGGAINRPSFFQNYLQVLPGRPALSPEEIETVEVNYLATFDRKYSINLSFFHNALDNLITRLIVVDENLNYDTSWFTNGGKLTTNGAEVTLSVEPSRRSYLEFSGTYQETDDHRTGFEDIDVAYSPSFLAHFKAQAELANGVTVATTGAYVAGMETFFDDAPVDAPGGVLDPIGRIGQRVDGHASVDVNVRIRNLFREGVWLNVHVSNVFDAQIRYPTFTNNQWADRGTLGYGRRVFVSLGRSF